MRKMWAFFWYRNLKNFQAIDLGSFKSDTIWWVNRDTPLRQGWHDLNHDFCQPCFAEFSAKVAMVFMRSFIFLSRFIFIFHSLHCFNCKWGVFGNWLNSDMLRVWLCWQIGEWDYNPAWDYPWTTIGSGVCRLGDSMGFWICRHLCLLASPESTWMVI